MRPGGEYFRPSDALSAQPIADLLGVRIGREPWCPYSGRAGALPRAPSFTSVPMTPVLSTPDHRRHPFSDSRLVARLPLLAVLAATLLGLTVLALAHPTPAIAADGGEPQRTAASDIRPDPARAGRDRGPLPGDGCFLSAGERRSPRCVYGDPSSDRRVVLFGDSHAMHHYPGLRPIVRKRGWRLVVLTKAGCPPMTAVKRGAPGEATECGIWRRRALRRIERKERPDMVIVGGSVNYRVYDRNGERLDEDAADEELESSYAEVLRRLGGTGARLVVMKDVPKPPYDVPSCVDKSRGRPGRCAFALPKGHWRAFDTRAARATGARLVDVTGDICRERRCRAVIARTLVYRAGSHLTAHFARTLDGALGSQLPRLR